MNKILFAGIATAALVISGVVGYRLGTGTWPELSRVWPPSIQHASDRAHEERKVLYWKNPSDETDYSATPKQTADGRDYLPVYDDEESDFAQQGSTKPSESRRVLYYRNPMGLPDVSQVPKKDSMGMDYIPVYEGDEDDSGIVKISPAKVQRTGVRSEPVVLRKVARPVRAPGIAKPDERTLYSVTLRADSFIEKLYVNEDGRHVEKGEPLFRIYSPDMVKVQVDYRIARAAGTTRSDAGAIQRLANLELPPAVIEELQKTGEPVLAFDWPSPIGGFILKKNVVEGMMARMGDELFRIADLSSIWVIADVSEQDIGQVAIGDKARISFRAFPGETFEGQVTFILHELDPQTRTGKVRIQLANPEHRIKHEMFADVDIETSHQEAKQLAVPMSALIDSGKRQVVIIDRGEGRFEPREVKTGLRDSAFVAIKEGVKEGDKVVVSANFLIDAESNLRAALAGFSDEPASKESDASGDTPHDDTHSHDEAKP